MADFKLLAEAAGHGAAAAERAELAAFGLTPGVWVSMAMATLIALLIWKKVPALITSGLDASIAGIRKQLAEAKALRSEAEALRKEYADKIAGAEKEAAAMLEHARHEAEAIIAKAQTDTADLIKRREKMAQDKIAAAERSAVEALRAQTAAAAAGAAQTLISATHDAKADKGLVDEAIAGL